MPKRGARKGFAPMSTEHRGWRDKVGLTFRPGRSVFVLVSHAAWGGLPAGKVPARLYRCFHWRGDRLGKYRLDAEYSWCLNYKMLESLGADVLATVPENILDVMRANPRAVVETNWAVSDEFETVTGDVAVTRAPIDSELHSVMLPADDADAAIHMGTLTLGVTKSGALKQRKKADDTWHNFATSWRSAAGAASLDELAAFPARPPMDAAPMPISAEYGVDAAPRFVEVAAGGGPAIGADGEQLRVGADEARIFGVTVLIDGATRDAYVDGDPYAEPLSGVEMLDHAALAHETTDAATCELLAEPDLEKRAYLNGKRELLPGWRRLEFSRSAIVAQFTAVNPSLLEGASLLEDADRLYSFEGKVVEGGKFVPLRRFGERLAAARVQRFAVERRGATRAAALTAMQELVVRRTEGKETALDPIEISSRGPWPLEYLAPLPVWTRMRRSPNERFLLSAVFESDADLYANLGLLAWPSPLSKAPRGYLSAMVPKLASECVAGATLQPRRVAGLRKHEVNFISYNTETRELTLRLSLARFNGAKRVRGATVGVPPKDPPPGAVAGQPVWKYSLMERDWVPWATRAPTPAELAVRYPGLAAWQHW